jgi:hypothetical protein
MRKSTSVPRISPTRKHKKKGERGRWWPYAASRQGRDAAKGANHGYWRTARDWGIRPCDWILDASGFPAKDWTGQLDWAGGGLAPPHLLIFVFLLSTSEHHLQNYPE